MKNLTKLTVLFVLVLFYLNSFFHCAAQTSVPGGNISGTWTSADSPYLVQGPVQITENSTLIIEPGVTVSFQGAYKLLVLGRLLAIGTAADSITFTSSDLISGWRGIRFDNTLVTNDTSKIIFCTLQYANTSGASADINGGALFFNSYSKAIISNCLIRFNKTDSYCGGSGAGIYCNNSSPVITNNIITNNHASFTCYGNGGGICCTGSSQPVIKGNTITYNWAGYGGGINCLKGSIENNIISGNYTMYNGGGIGIWGYDTVTIIKNTISYNTAGGWLGGGGIYSENSKVKIIDNTITNNTSLAEGGGGIYSLSAFLISGNTISNNIASNNNGGGGGGISCSSQVTDIVNNTITNNNAGNGGGIFFNGFNGTVRNNTIANNFASNGGALFCYSGSNPAIRNCILWGNTSTSNSNQLYLFDEPSDPGFYNCDVEGGSTPFNSGGNFYTGTYLNNINTDPEFISPSAGSDTTYNGTFADWSLQTLSVCIDAGDPLGIYPSFDKEGNPRISGCNIDMGAFEIQQSGSLSVNLIAADASDYYVSDGSAAVTASGGTPPYAYNWSNGANTSSISNLAFGPYTVTITDANGCARVSAFFISYPNSINQYATSHEFSIYPNPAGSNINIIINEKSHIDIYSFQGQLIKSMDADMNTSSIDITNFSPGLYFLSLKTQDWHSVRTFIKE